MCSRGIYIVINCFDCGYSSEMITIDRFACIPIESFIRLHIIINIVPDLRHYTECDNLSDYNIIILRAVIEPAEIAETYRSVVSIVFASPIVFNQRNCNRNSRIWLVMLLDSAHDSELWHLTTEFVTIYRQVNE